MPKVLKASTLPKYNPSHWEKLWGKVSRRTITQVCAYGVDCLKELFNTGNSNLPYVKWQKKPVCIVQDKTPKLIFMIEDPSYNPGVGPSSAKGFLAPKFHGVEVDNKKKFEEMNVLISWDGVHFIRINRMFKDAHLPL